MGKFLCSILCSLVCCLNLLAQEDFTDLLYANYEDKGYKAFKANDFELAYIYLDSMASLGTKYAWSSKILRGRVLAFVEDSMQVSKKILEDCLRYYEKQEDTSNLLASYKENYFIHTNLNDIQASIKLLNKALDLSYSYQDLEAISHFEWGLGDLYLNELEDMPNALVHLKRGVAAAIQNEDWHDACWISSSMSKVFRNIGDSINEEKTIYQALDYALNIDSLEFNHYDGYLNLGFYFLRKEDYQNAIKNALIAFRGASEVLEDYDVLIYCCEILIEAYWKVGEIEKGYHYIKIGFDLMDGEGSVYIQRNVYYYGAKILEAKGLYQEALKAWDLFYKYEKIFYEKAQDKAIARQLYSGEVNRKNAEKAQVELNLQIVREQAKFQWLVIIGILVLLGVTISYSFLIYRKKQETAQLNKVLSASQEVVLQQKEILLQDYQKLQKTLEEKEEEAKTVYFTQSAIQLKFEDIIYLESDNNYVLIHTKDRETPLLERIKMIDLVKQFPDTMFTKIHRSYYINKKHVVARPSKYIVELSNGAVLKPSRSYVDNLEDILL